MEEKLMELLTEIRSDVDFKNEQALIDDGILESFDVIQIVTNIMDEFDVMIDADDIEPENLNSFAQICDWVQKKISEK